MTLPVVVVAFAAASWHVVENSAGRLRLPLARVENHVLARRLPRLRSLAGIETVPK